MSQKLTDTIVKALEAPASGNRITYDAEVKGFGCRVSRVPKNAKQASAVEDRMPRPGRVWNGIPAPPARPGRKTRA